MEGLPLAGTFLSELSLTHPVFAYASMVGGVLFALNHAFIRSKILTISGAPAFIEFIYNLVKDKGEFWNLFLQNTPALVGSLTLTAATGVTTFASLAAVYSIFFRGENKLNAFGDFWRGGHTEIDWRHKKNLDELNELLRQHQDTHLVYPRIFKLVRNHVTRLNCEKEFTDFITMFLDSSFSVVFGRNHPYRIALYLIEPSDEHNLKLATSFHITKPTPDHVNLSWPLTDSVAGKVFRTGHIIIHPSSDSKGSFKKGRNPKASYAKSFACIRVESDKLKWGVLSIDTGSSSFPTLNEGQWLFLSFLAESIADCLAQNNGCGKWNKFEVK